MTEVTTTTTTAGAVALAEAEAGLRGIVAGNTNAIIVAQNSPIKPPRTGICYIVGHWLRYGGAVAAVCAGTDEVGQHRRPLVAAELFDGAAD